MHLTANDSLATKMGMKKIALAVLLALTACGDNDAVRSPDAFDQPPQVILDARAPDAGPIARGPQPADFGGCNFMGNLPAARTITIANGDPVPPDLLNEIQDMIVAANRKPFQRSFYPRFVYNNTGGFNGASNGQPCLISSAATIAFFEICYEPGETISALSIDVFGGGGSTLVMHLDYATGPGAGASVLATVASFTPAASWNPVVFTVTPQLLAAGGYLHVDVTTSAAGLYLGRATATFSR